MEIKAAAASVAAGVKKVEEPKPRADAKPQEQVEARPQEAPPEKSQRPGGIDVSA